MPDGFYPDRFDLDLLELGTDRPTLGTQHKPVSSHRTQWNLMLLFIRHNKPALDISVWLLMYGYDNF